MSARKTSGMHSALRNLCIAAAIAVVPAGQAQVAFPDQYIQDVEWTEGTHHFTLAQPIIAPGYAPEPTIISGIADAEFVSGTSVHLTEGFHAGGFTGEGRFHARIDAGIDSADAVAIISPTPDHIVDGMLHVPKWEKLEVGLKLHQQYLDAISRFFAHYYPYDPYPYDPTIVNDNRSQPGNVDALHDLNPYADDSLQVFMVLTDPDGGQRMKWAFYMREVKWGPGDTLALPMDDPDHPLDAYRMRFRFAPDKEGAWLFRIGIRAPHTHDVNGALLPEGNYATYGFYCDPPLEGKHGSLHVDTINRMMLEHEDDTPFFGMGTNMANAIHDRSDSPFGAGDKFYQRDMTVMKQSMDQLHEVGGNFLRMMHGQDHFAPEAFNLGVYDRYRGLIICQVGEYSNERGDCQHQSWSFDQLLEHAAQNNIYIQLCVEPTHPSAGNDSKWGSTPYVRHFLNTARDPVLHTYELKNYFYQNGDPNTRNTPASVFYFWKRKYKYIMDRWGYSPSLAIIEPFNEIDQMLGYYKADTLVGDSAHCSFDRLVWPVQAGLPETLDSWLTDITDYVRGPVDPGDPVASPLGAKKLFLMSYAWNDPNRENYQTFYKPFYNEKVDLMDAHMYLNPQLIDANHPDDRLKNMVGNAQGFVDRTSSAHFPAKPFNTGESNYSTNLDDDFGWEIEKIFMNYDVSFHNEIWAGAFSGKFATGSSWQWERVFWWPDGLPEPPPDDFNIHQQAFSNVEGATNFIDIGIGTGFPVKNRPLYHHFKPLADFIGNASLQDSYFFDDILIPQRVFDEDHELECYYLANDLRTMAIGWVHNRNAWVMNNYYVKSGVSYQNLLGCDPPSPSTSRYLQLDGFNDDLEYYITWFPTHLDTEETPPSPIDPIPNTSDPDNYIRIHNGTITIDLLDQFAGVANNYLDTLHSDYAFVIAPAPMTKSRLPTGESEVKIEDVWDYRMYPNPVREALYLQFPDETPKEITLGDLSGRRIQRWSSVSGTLQRLPIDHLAKGVYTVAVSDGVHSRTKKLIIQ